MQTLTKADMVEHLMYKNRLTKQQARQVVDGFFEQVAFHLSEGRTVKLSGFGNFDLKDKTARIGRNPKTGETAEICARRVVTFRAGQKFRALVESELNAAKTPKKSPKAKQ